MTDLKITEFTETTTPLLTDIIPIVTDPSGSPANKKVTVNNLLYLGGFPSSATVFVYEGLVTSGSITNLTSVSVNTSLPFNFYAVPGGTSGDGDELTFTRLLKAGTYTFLTYGLKLSSRGKLDWYIDGSTFITGQDWYAASSALGTFSATGITVVGDGLHTIKCKVNGKNASSTNYLISLTFFSLVRTGA
jgi:hypothetical protein